MQTEKVELATNDLNGEWHHANSYKQLIIICHGLNSSHKNPTLVAIREGLNQKGYDTFTFNFSENIGGFDIEHQVNDIKEIANHFSNYDELIVLAASFAALTAAIATHQVPRISKLITLNGFFGGGALGQKHRKLYMKFRGAALIVPKYRNILKYFKKELQPSLINVPILIIHSEADKHVHIKQSQNFYNHAVAPRRFDRLNSADHGITSPIDRQQVITEIDRWLQAIS